MKSMKDMKIAFPVYILHVLHALHGEIKYPMLKFMTIGHKLISRSLCLGRVLRRNLFLISFFVWEQCHNLFFTGTANAAFGDESGHKTGRGHIKCVVGRRTAFRRHQNR